MSTRTRLYWGITPLLILATCVALGCVLVDMREGDGSETSISPVVSVNVPVRVSAPW